MSSDRVVHGWLRDSAAPQPCHIQVLHEGRVAAEAQAGDFRPDLLRSGHGHGHYGFRARLRTALPAGRCSLVLHLPRQGVSAASAVTVPGLDAAVPQAVEALLAVPPGWGVGDLLQRPECLGMPRHLAAMGGPRFVDGLYRFVLSRWPSAAEARMNLGALQAGRVTPHGLLVELLTCRERADMAPGLPSPFDPDFPFEASSFP